MTDTSSPAPQPAKGKTVYASNAANAVYGLGLIGAIVYFIQHASSFWAGVLGILEALVWPAIVVYKLLEFLHL
jgi:hypothetical protein